jgi:hypothetical protein
MAIKREMHFYAYCCNVKRNINARNNAKTTQGMKRTKMAAENGFMVSPAFTAADVLINKTPYFVRHVPGASADKVSPPEQCVHDFLLPSLRSSHTQSSVASAMSIEHAVLQNSTESVMDECEDLDWSDLDSENLGTFPAAGEWASQNDDELGSFPSTGVWPHRDM